RLPSGSEQIDGLARNINNELPIHLKQPGYLLAKALGASALVVTRTSVSQMMSLSAPLVSCTKSSSK
ncbi:hypothetical protein, partial [Mesorhizobium tamadayense]|uniref:hypothetical protein n=1 Tax=Mesorhizobium tamadayense TaxID=425306 RepID=UPI00197DED9D